MERDKALDMTGGDAKVRVGNELVLIGPATYIARLEVPS